MKRVLKWVEEEKIAIIILLLAIGIILNTPPKAFVLTGLFVYGALLIVGLHLVHRLYVKFKTK